MAERNRRDRAPEHRRGRGLSGNLGADQQRAQVLNGAVLNRALRGTRRGVGCLALLLAVAVPALLAWGWGRKYPQDLPWTSLDLSQPVGMFTGRKLTALHDDTPVCRALLDRAGVRYTALPKLTAEGGSCGYDNAVRLGTDGSRTIGYRPASLGVACPVAAALAMWEWNSIQPAAQTRFGQPVARIEHFGSYSCRRLYGRDAGAWSEHARANAVDIAAFVLRDGTRVSVVGDWDATDPRKAGFLRDVHAGACGLFATVLGPDYNAAHRDHFHLDQAARGGMGWRACR